MSPEHLAGRFDRRSHSKVSLRHLDRHMRNLSGPQRRRRGLRARTARHRTPLPTILRAEGPASPRLRSQRRKIPLRRGRALATMTRTSPPGQRSVRSATARRRASRQASGVSGPSWRTSSGPSTAIFLLRQIRSSSIREFPLSPMVDSRARVHPTTPGRRSWNPWVVVVLNPSVHRMAYSQTVPT